MCREHGKYVSNKYIYLCLRCKAAAEAIDVCNVFLAEKLNCKYQ